MENRRATIKKLTIRELLKPHVKALTIGFIAVVGEGVANLLEPWPLKIVLDSVLRSRPTHGWLNQFIQSTVGADKFAILKFACAAVLGIAVLDAISSYTEKYFTTSVGQWVTHDLRRTLYSRIQQLSLAYHDQKRSGDLLSRVTSDIDAIQSFINTALLGALINLITLVGMIGVMLYLNWRFTLIALSVSPVLFLVVYSYTRRIKKAALPFIARLDRRRRWKKALPQRVDCQALRGNTAIPRLLVERFLQLGGEADGHSLFSSS
jgi:subfamily B ATP-binding cassette protein MsbA